MEYRIEIKKDLAKKKWNKWLLKSYNAHLFQSKQWADYLQELSGLKPYYLMIYDNKKICGQLLFFKAPYTYNKSLKGISRFFEPLIKSIYVLTWKNGPIIHEKDEFSHILSLILNEVEKSDRISLIYDINCPIYDNIEHKKCKKVLKINKYDTKLWATFIIDLSLDIEVLWRNIKKEARRNVKRCEKNGVNIIITKEYADIENYCKIIEEHKKRQGYEMNFEDCVKWIELQLKFLKDNFNLFMAYYRNKPISGLITWDFNGIINEVGVAHSYYALKNKIYAQDLIKWNIIKWGKENKKKLYDLTGVNPNPKTEKEKGIYRYKSKWGGKFTKYKIYSKCFTIKGKLLNFILKVKGDYI